MYNSFKVKVWVKQKGYYLGLKFKIIIYGDTLIA